MRVLVGRKSSVMRVFAETSQCPGVHKCGPGSTVDGESQISEHPMPKRSKHISIEDGNDVSEDSRSRLANVAQRRLHEKCERYHMGSDSEEGSTAAKKGVTKPTHYRVRTKSKSERLLTGRGK